MTILNGFLNIFFRPKRRIYNGPSAAPLPRKDLLQQRKQPESSAFKQPFPPSYQHKPFAASSSTTGEHFFLDHIQISLYVTRINHLYFIPSRLTVCYATYTSPTIPTTTTIIITRHNTYSAIQISKCRTATRHVTSCIRSTRHINTFEPIRIPKTHHNYALIFHILEKASRSSYTFTRHIPWNGFDITNASSTAATASTNRDGR